MTGISDGPITHAFASFVYLLSFYGRAMTMTPWEDNGARDKEWKEMTVICVALENVSIAGYVTEMKGR